MDELDSGYLGAVIHAALAVAGLIEWRTAKSRPRILLTGAVVGWHLYSTIYHLTRAERTAIVKMRGTQQ
jgi:hypothetical protein